MPLLALLCKRVSLCRSVAELLRRWCFQMHLIPSRMDPWQHTQGWILMCLVVPAACSPGDELPAETTAHPAPPCSMAGLSLLGRATKPPSPTRCFCSRNVLWDAPGTGPPYGRKPLHSPLHRRAGAQLPSPWAVLAWETAVMSL